jgi:hypothetical protein
VVVFSGCSGTAAWGAVTVHIVFATGVVVAVAQQRTSEARGRQQKKRPASAPR